ncbi:MAG: ElyC/SanA/YdcF family protein [Chloroflexota bacterium]|nr:ElyC/SanA/YdcF family protein [Chloroflexota bacterium]
MFFKLILTFTLCGLILLLSPRLITSHHAQLLTRSVENVNPQPVAIVFGAGLWRDGSPTPVLRDRVATAAELYFAGKVEKLLMSGDNSFEDYNEPVAMKNYALSLDVPADAIVMDYAGRRTYDTCYRARDIFQVESAILVTQDFHLDRALYICNKLGVIATGIPANQRIYRRRSMLYWRSREIVATFTALLDVHILHPTPILGEPEPISSLESPPSPADMH